MPRVIIDHLLSRLSARATDMQRGVIARTMRKIWSPLVPEKISAIECYVQVNTHE